MLEPTSTLQLWIQVACDVLSTTGTLLLAAIAIWQERILNLLNPVRARIQEGNFAGKMEGTSDHQVYTYHVKAVCLSRFRSPRGCRIEFREIVRKSDAGQEERSSYPVWRQLPWAPSERTSSRVDISAEQTADLGVFHREQDLFVLSYYNQGGDFDQTIVRGTIATVPLHLKADNLSKDAIATLDIDMRTPHHTKPVLTIRYD